MDFQSAMETFAEAWVAANTQTPLTEAADAQQTLSSRGNEILAASSSSSSHPHDIILSGKEDAEMDRQVVDGSGPTNVGGENSRTVTNLMPRCSSAPEPYHPKSNLVRPVCNAAKSIPVHCIVEQVPSPQNCDEPGGFIQSTVELDSYAIVPSGTPFCELVKTALVKLGYSSADIIGAKGAIQIKNWKPLAFETITEDSTATVAGILGELTTVATLRIRMYSRPKISSGNDVKEKLLQLLLTQSQSLLIGAGCPIEEALLTLISKGSNQCKIPEDTRRRFDKWYVQQVLEHRRLSPITGRGSSIPESSVSGSGGNVNNCANLSSNSATAAAAVTSGNNDMAANGTTATSTTTTGSNHSISGNVSVAAVAAAAAAAAAAHRTRMRTSFDPEMELPKLHLWFGENQHPTRLQIQQYVRELNSFDSRKGRKPLDVNNVVYWFKNARAAYKRAEQRHSNGSGGVGGGGIGVGTINATASVTGNGRADDASPCHDSASDDNLVCRDGLENCVAVEMLEERRFRLSLDSNGDADMIKCTNRTSSGGGGGGNKNSVSAALSVGAIDLSTTHRDASYEKSLNGHWKAAKSSSSSSSNLLLLQDDLIKQEPTDGGTTSPVSTDDNDEDDDEEDEDDDEDFDYESCCNNTIGLDESDRKSASVLPYAVGSGDVVGRYRSRYLHQQHRQQQQQQHQHHQHHQHQHHHHQQQHNRHGHGHGHSNNSLLYMAGFVPSSVAAALVDERRKRNRTFIDPVSEVPRLEQWFSFNTHPPHSLILKYTDELNQMPYRQKFPRLEPKNVQFWFKNRRAKCKRLRLSVNLAGVAATATSSSSSPPPGLPPSSNPSQPSSAAAVAVPTSSW